MDAPKDRAEALARGFRPVPIEEATARLARARSQRKDFTTMKDGALQVDCAVCHDGTKCDTVIEGGKVTYYFCKGGACSPKDALIGDLEL